MYVHKLLSPLVITAGLLFFLAACSPPVAAPLPPTLTPRAPTPLPPTAVPPTPTQILPTLIPPTPTPVPPTESPPTLTPAPATDLPPTPTPPVLITSAEMLVGNWQPLLDHKDATFLQINSNGTCRQSYSLEGLTNTPEVECTYAFEGTDLLITAVKLNGVPECPSPTGGYQVRLLGDDLIQLVAAKDSCAPRIRSTRGEYQRIP